MRLFGKKNMKSTLRFCQSATELDTSHLFADWPLTLAISRLTETHHPALEATKEAYGYGLVHDTYGHGCPLLPVQVQFLFSPPYTEGDPGYGRVWKHDMREESNHYQADVVIYDPDRRIYEGFVHVFEHAAMSGNSFAHLILLKKPFTSDPKEREAAGKAEREMLKILMKQIDAGEADMPDIVFDRVVYEDNLVLKAPSWSWEWIDDLLSRPKYHSREAAAWRRGSA
jgi:hypothetical protein